MFGRLGPWEILLIAAIALLIIGPRKLPEFGRAAGQMLREFRSGMKQLTDEVNDDSPSATPQKKSPPTF
ncbi:MAG: twin-arginine translocase TatA/TatE family subunit [Thermaerobacterales bacterium]